MLGSLAGFRIEYEWSGFNLPSYWPQDVQRVTRRVWYGATDRVATGHPDDTGFIWRRQERGRRERVPEQDDQQK